MTLRERAEANGRTYVTPEDVSAAFAAGEPVDAVRLEVLEILGGAFGAEDASLCAFIAARGTAE